MAKNFIYMFLEYVICLFVFLALQPFWLYFHSPVVGFSLLFFDVS